MLLGPAPSPREPPGAPSPATGPRPPPGGARGPREARPLPGVRVRSLPLAPRPRGDPAVRERGPPSPGPGPWCCWARLFPAPLAGPQPRGASLVQALKPGALPYNH